MSKASDIGNKKKIYDLIKRKPGLKLSKISEILKMSVQLVDFHTRNLEKEGLINIIKKKGCFKRFYVKEKVGAIDRKYFNILRQEKPLKIVLFLLENPYSKHKEIVKNLDMPPSTITYYINKLVKNGIIFLKITDEGRGYIVKNEKEVNVFLTQYKPSKVQKRFKET